MIPYADDIENADIIDYWGAGYILIEYKGHWSAYELRRVMDDGTCMLSKAEGLGHPDASAIIAMDKEAFFNKVLLHRPSLGTVITEYGEIVHMSWKAAKGDKIKSIIPKDVHIKSLGWTHLYKEPPKIPLTRLANLWSHGLLQERAGLGQTRLMETYPERHRMTLAGHNLGVQEKPRTGTMELVLQYLNHTPPSFEDAVLEALTTGGCVAENGVLCTCAEGSKDVLCYTGHTKIGVARVNTDGAIVFVPCEHKRPAHYRVMCGIAKRLIPVYGGDL